MCFSSCTSTPKTKSLELIGINRHNRQRHLTATTTSLPGGITGKDVSNPLRQGGLLHFGDARWEVVGASLAHPFFALRGADIFSLEQVKYFPL
jgi:hypothetical protein